jgi:hypothetical protein
LLTPSGLRDLFSTGPGPDRGGSKPGRKGWAHIPEKFGMDAAPCVPVVAGPTAGGAVCPNAGATDAAANVTHKRKSRRHAFMISSLRARSSSSIPQGYILSGFISMSRT